MHNPFTNPRHALIRLTLVEVPDSRVGEWLAEDSHSRFLPRLTDKREPLDIREVVQTELGIFPKGSHEPAVKTVHSDQHPHLAVDLDRSFNLWCEVRVVFLSEFPAQVQNQNLSAFFLVQFDGHGMTPSMGK